MWSVCNSMYVMARVHFAVYTNYRHVVSVKYIYLYLYIMGRGQCALCTKLPTVGHGVCVCVCVYICIYIYIYIYIEREREWIEGDGQYVLAVMTLCPLLSQH
jgi:hypothetical protein